MNVKGKCPVTDWGDKREVTKVSVQPKFSSTEFVMVPSPTQVLRRQLWSDNLLGVLNPNYFSQKKAFWGQPFWNGFTLHNSPDPLPRHLICSQSQPEVQNKVDALWTQNNIGDCSPFMIFRKSINEEYIYLQEMKFWIECGLIHDGFCFANIWAMVTMAFYWEMHFLLNVNQCQ